MNQTLICRSGLSSLLRWMHNSVSIPLEVYQSDKQTPLRKAEVWLNDWTCFALSQGLVLTSELLSHSLDFCFLALPSIYVSQHVWYGVFLSSSLPIIHAIFMPHFIWHFSLVSATQLSHLTKDLDLANHKDGQIKGNPFSYQCGTFLIVHILLAKCLS